MDAGTTTPAAFFPAHKQTKPPLLRPASMSLSEQYPQRLQAGYETIRRMREMMELMKKSQAMRGEENLKLRKANRAATHKTWRQMKAMQLFMHEIGHPGLQPFIVGAGYVSFRLVLVLAGDARVFPCP
jgi:hypothetical protein